MNCKFTLRETLLLVTVVAFAVAFMASAIDSNRLYPGAYVTAESVVDAVQAISPKAQRANSCGRDGRSLVRLCFEYDVPEEHAENFLSKLKDQLASGLQAGNCEHVDIGRSLFRDDIQELRFETAGYFVDVALYLQEDSPSPKDATRVLGP